MMCSLKSAVLATVLVHAADAGMFRTRMLSLAKIAGYEPLTDVTDHLRIDLDVVKIQDYLNEGAQSSFSHAKSVYEKGAFSKSMATLTFTGDGFPSALKKGDLVVGKSTEGTDVVLMAAGDVTSGATSVKFQYKDGDCNVGGLPGPSGGSDGSGEQIWTGCLTGNGTLSIDSTSSTANYMYNVETGNTNDRTIQYFSTTANEKMRPSADQAFYPEFQKYYDYYGDADYGDKWVSAAFDGSATGFSSGRGDADFSKYEADARSQAIQKGTVYLNVWMYVIRELQAALSECGATCESDDCDGAQTGGLDEAVAFYAGSLEGTEGTAGKGYLLYTVANKRSANFKTAGENGDSVSGNSKVNIEILQQFDQMRTSLTSGKCDDASKNVERIVQLMTVPLVQSTLRYAQKRSVDASDKADEVEGAAFAASIIPMVHACNEGDAQTIFDNMKVGSTETDFGAVKSAFENSYGCLGITCADVGGVYDEGTSTYMEGAAPCGGAGTASSNSSGSSVNVGLAVGLSLGAVAAIALVFLWCKCCRKSSMIETKSDDNPIA